MPNHIKNRLKINGTIAQITSVFNKYSTHYPARVHTSCDGNIVCRNKDGGIGWLDPRNGTFLSGDNIIIGFGIPEEYEIQIKNSEIHFPDFEKIIPPPRCDEYNDIPNQAAVRDSPNWWRTWNISNWGTKWNSYSSRTEEFGVYTFETAWSGVPNLIMEMSKQNPDISFEYTFADEDSGQNVGMFRFENGEVSLQYYPIGGSKEAFDIYFELNPEDRYNYELIDGMYKYIDNED